MEKEADSSSARVIDHEGAHPTSPSLNQDDIEELGETLLKRCKCLS
jgi:hypothetical protein